MAVNVHLRGALSALAVAVAAAASAPAQAELAIAPLLSKTSIDAGKPGLEISVSAFNSGAAATVDVYLAVQAPNGDFYSFRGSDWVPGIKPWFNGIQLSRNFSYPPTRVAVLPGLGAGQYTVYTAFARPGTLDLLHLSQGSFLVASSSGGIRFGALTLSEYQTASPAAGGGRKVASEVEAAGTFVKSNKSLEFTREVLDGAEPPLGQCVLNKISGNIFALPGGLQYQTLDVGDAITLKAAAGGATVGSIDLVKDPDLVAFGQNIYGLPAGVTLPAGTVSGNLQYTFAAAGGSQLAGFSASAAGLDALQLTSPALATFDSISSSSGLPLAWNGNRGIGEVFVSISGSNFATPFPDTCSLDCRFADNGQASVPAAKLQQLKACVAEGRFGAPGQVEFSISRNRYQFFNTNRNELGFGVLLLEAGQSAQQLKLN